VARILIGVGLVTVVAAVAAVLFAHGSQAAPAAPATTIQRTFVSTGGNDANACTRAEPCRNFAAAIANTTAGGEVVALDSGGYGAFSIDKAITIAGAPGAHVAVTVFSGTGITVNVGANDTVVLRNLYVTGLGGLTGIFFQGGGRLFVESVVASGLSNRGLEATAPNAELFVRDSVFRSNASAGVQVTGSLRAEVADSRADRNGFGFYFAGGARGSVSGSIATRNTFDGFAFLNGAVFAVSDSVADANGAGGIEVFHTGTVVTLSEVVLTNHLTHAGLFLTNGSPVARIGGSTITGNESGLVQESGVLETFGDNLVRGNLTDTSGTITAVGKT